MSVCKQDTHTTCDCDQVFAGWLKKSETFVENHVQKTAAVNSKNKQQKPTCIMSLVCN